MLKATVSSPLYIYQNEDRIDVELKCLICFDPFQSPVNCHACGQTYCRECIRLWSEEKTCCPICKTEGVQYPAVISRALRNQLDRLLVHCSLCDQADIQRWTFDDHLANRCPKQVVSCTNQCGWTGCRENLSDHLIKCRQKVFFWSKLWSWWK